MLVVCDGGSTKADWKIWKADGTVASVTTQGFNPNYNSEEQITAIAGSELQAAFDVQAPGKVFYYGAGCWEARRKGIVASALGRVFTGSTLEIHHDLLAAARATCGNDPGIACILGTGSNSVLYDGEQEIDNVTNLGFLLGDEGSGAAIGKKLVQAFFYREMPEDLKPVIERACPNGRQDILDEVYGRGSVPAAYLASFVRHFSPLQQHPFVKNIIKESFLEFLTRHVCKYEGHQILPIHFVGSVAFFHQDILREALQELKLRPGVVLHKPIFNLLNYHMSLEKGFTLDFEK